MTEKPFSFNQPGAAREAEPTERQRPCTILVVDDDADWRELIPGTIGPGKEEGGPAYNCQVAHDAQEGLDFLRDKQVDLIVTDGLEGSWREVALEGLRQGIPVVVLSLDEAIVTTARQAGFPAFKKDWGEESEEWIAGLQTHVMAAAEKISEEKTEQE